VVSGVVVPERFEHFWMERVIEPLLVDRVLGEGGGG
jgi:hypothetical protein